VGEYSRGGDFEGVGGSPRAVIDVRFSFNTMGVSHEGNMKGFLICWLKLMRSSVKRF
jgi:hypothetical protein